MRVKEVTSEFERKEKKNKIMVVGREGIVPQVGKQINSEVLWVNNRWIKDHESEVEGIRLVAGFVLGGWTDS